MGWLAANISGLEVLLRTPRGCKRRSLKWQGTGGDVGAGFDPLQMCPGLFLTLVFYSSVLGTVLG